MSASSRPTLRPCFARATARFDDTVDFPTPPLPDPIAKMRSTPETGLGPPSCFVGCPPIFRLGGAEGAACGLAADLDGPWAVSTALTLLIPATLPTTASAARRTPSMRAAASGSGASMTNRTVPPSTFKARIISRDTKSPPSGSVRDDRAFRTSSLLDISGPSFGIGSLRIPFGK